MVPASASDFYDAQQRRKTATLVIADRLWRRIDPSGNWSEQFAPIAILLGEVIGKAQRDTAMAADQYITKVTDELDLPSPDAALNPDGFAGWNGNGVAIESALGYSVATAGTAYASGATATDALDAGRSHLLSTTSTSLADIARAAVSVGIASTKRTGYVRMLNPPSCSRCAILAGKFYKWNAGFKRHPRCDCLHIPASENIAGDLTTSPNAYFHSLDEAEQDRIFTKAGAQSIRDGADVSQVVNARSGMATATDGRIITNTGTTKRAWYGGGYAARRYGNEAWFDTAGYESKYVGKRGAVQNYRERRTNHARLMPEQIYAMADGNRDEAVRLLKLYGFVI